jgi:hypothetical protein
MRQIYSCAQVTFTVDDTPSCQWGFWNWDVSDFRRIEGDCWAKECKPAHRDILSTRGWALQERILSHRLLRFSDNGIRRECDECCRDEDGDANIDFLGLGYRTFRLLKRSRRHDRLGTSAADYDDGDSRTTHVTDFLTSGSVQSVYFAWGSTMEEYPGRDLTHPRDKTSAISGLASFVVRCQGLAEGSYLAGLWREDLVEGLLWYVCQPGPANHISTYIAPTWSWASICGRIQYFRERY